MLTSSVIDQPPGLLCVANYPAGTGYAWSFIEDLYGGVAAGLAEHGVRSWVAYPELQEPPAIAARYPIEPVTLPFGTGSDFRAESMQFIRNHGIRALYLTDRDAWSPAYRRLRSAGVDYLAVHDHTSGERTPPPEWKRALKWLRVRIPGTLADDVLAVSEFVGRRKRVIERIPPHRVRVVPNSVVIPEEQPEAAARLRGLLHLPPDALIVGAAARATPAKGIEHLMRAFDRLERSGGVPHLVCFGDGPHFDAWAATRAGLRAVDRIHLPGYRTDARDLLAGADVCAVPSIWQEAFGLAALEPMARGRAVVASRVGGLKEVVEDGVSGVLVPAADEESLAAALQSLLSDPERRRRLGEAARQRAVARHRREDQVAALTRIFLDGLRRKGVLPTVEARL